MRRSARRAVAIGAGGIHHHDLAGVGGVDDGRAGRSERAVVIARRNSRGGNAGTVSGETATAAKAATSALATDKHRGSEQYDQREREYFFHFSRYLPTKSALKISKLVSGSRDRCGSLC